MQCIRTSRNGTSPWTPRALGGRGATNPVAATALSSRSCAGPSPLQCVRPPRTSLREDHPAPRGQPLPASRHPRHSRQANRVAGHRRNPRAPPDRAKTPASTPAFADSRGMRPTRDSCKTPSTSRGICNIRDRRLTETPSLTPSSRSSDLPTSLIESKSFDKIPAQRHPSRLCHPSPPPCDSPPRLLEASRCRWPAQVAHLPWTGSPSSHNLLDNGSGSLRRGTSSNMLPPRQRAQLPEATPSNWPRKPDPGIVRESPPLDPTLHPQPPARNLLEPADLHLEAPPLAPWCSALRRHPNHLAPPRLHRLGRPTSNRRLHRPITWAPCACASIA